MIHQDYKWKSFDGIMLYGQCWMPSEQPAAVINYVHGFMDHSNRFGKWAARFVEKGYAVVAIDLRGHGHSEGRRGYAKNYSDFLSDIDVLMSNSRNLFKDTPHFLYGHSFGGNIVTNYLIKGRNLPEASVISSPWFTLAIPPSLIRMIMAHIIRFILPGKTVDSNIAIQYLSRDPAVVEAYKHDPLVHHLIRPKLFIEIEKHGLKSSRSIYRIHIPLLVMHGTQDMICSFRQTRNFVMNSDSGTTFREWPGAYHELHNEPNETEVFEFIENWLKKTLSAL